MSETYDNAGNLTGSLLKVEYARPATDTPSADEVAASTQWWLNLARAPELDNIYVSLPLDGYFADVSPTLVIQLPVTADDAALNALMRRYAQLRKAAWNLSVPAPERYVHPDSYISVGRLPDSRSRRAWQQLVALIRPPGLPRPIGTAEGSTRIPPRVHTHPPTNVNVNLDLDWNTAGEFEHVAREAAALLYALAPPVLFEMSTRVLDSRVATSQRQPAWRSLAVTVGGCTPSESRYTHPSEPLEAELRRQHEHC